MPKVCVRLHYARTSKSALKGSTTVCAKMAAKGVALALRAHVELLSN